MTPAEARDMYRSTISDFGEVVTVRRIGSPDVSVRARVTGYQPDELINGINQGDRKVIVLAEDVPFDPLLRRGDKIIVRGRSLNVEVVDDSTRRVAGELIAYELTARG